MGPGSGAAMTDAREQGWSCACAHRGARSTVIALILSMLVLVSLMRLLALVLALVHDQGADHGSGHVGHLPEPVEAAVVQRVAHLEGMATTNLTRWSSHSRLSLNEV